MPCVCGVCWLSRPAFSRDGVLKNYKTVTTRRTPAPDHPRPVCTCVLPLPPWPIFPSLLPFPFPGEVVPMEPLDRPCFTALCRVRTEEGQPSPLARGVQVDHPFRSALCTPGGRDSKLRFTQYNPLMSVPGPPPMEATDRRWPVPFRVRISGIELLCKSRAHTTYSRRPRC